MQKSKTACLLLLLCCYFVAAQSQPSTSRPNIVFILVDDLGYNDLSTYGNQQIPTPNLDSLAKNGIRMLNAYCSSPICSPSRAGIMTGRYQQRFGFEFQERDAPIGHYSIKQKIAFIQRAIRNGEHVDLSKQKKMIPNGLPDTEITLASLLKKSGYATAAIGKWNLGVAPFQLPHAKGFDYFFGFYSAAGLYSPTSDTNIYNKHFNEIFDPPVWYREGNSALRRNDSIISDSMYLTYRLAKEATNFIQQKKDSTFFLYLAFNAPHTPFQVPKQLLAEFSNVKDDTKRVYYAMISALDKAIGEVIRSLKANNLFDNTLIVFTSDNGGATYTGATDNEPLKGGKMSHFDGGLKVPFIISYPSALPKGITYNPAISTLDIFTTCLAAAKTNPPTDRIIDGINLLPYLTNTTKDTPHNTLYWKNGFSKAIKKGNFKLYINEKEDVIFLYDISVDAGERNDISKSNPEKVKELTADLNHWENTLEKPLWRSRFYYRLKVRDRYFMFPT